MSVVLEEFVHVCVLKQNHSVGIRELGFLNDGGSSEFCSVLLLFPLPFLPQQLTNLLTELT